MRSSDFFINFIVVSPQPVYVDYIGGVTVAHTLANALSQVGENVYLYANSTHSNYKVQCIPWGSEVAFDDENTVVILIAGAGEHTYLPNIPEFLTKAKHIVRWLVNHQVEPYPKDNKFYKFHEYWDIVSDQLVDGYLSVIEVDQTLFTNKGKQRNGVSYLIKGGLDEEPQRAIHDPNDFCIDRFLYSIPSQDRMAFLADTFNKSEFFISYTPFTFMSVLAALCGCPSIVVPKSDFEKDKWLEQIWCAKYGIAVGLEDLPRAMETLPLVPKLLQEYLDITQPNQVKQFVYDCYNWLK